MRFSSLWLSLSRTRQMDIFIKRRLRLAASRFSGGEVQWSRSGMPVLAAAWRFQGGPLQPAYLSLSSRVNSSQKNIHFVNSLSSVYFPPPCSLLHHGKVTTPTIWNPSIWKSNLKTPPLTAVPQWGLLTRLSQMATPRTKSTLKRQEGLLLHEISMAFGYANNIDSLTPAGRC